MGTSCSTRKNPKIDKLIQPHKSSGLNEAMEKPSVEHKELEMLTTRRLIEMKWDIVAVNDWYASWRIACQSTRSLRMTAQEYSTDDIFVVVGRVSRVCNYALDIRTSLRLRLPRK